MITIVVKAIAFLTLMLFSVLVSASEGDLWAAIKQGGHAVLMRHALAPGTGDPGHFVIGDCATQRNLSDTGRQQARAIGQRFRDNGIDQIAVYTSQWCRCQETARLLDLGEVNDFAGLNSFFANRSQRDEKTESALELIRSSVMTSSGIGPSIVLVTHQVNITALVDVYPDSGEMIVVKPVGDALEVVGGIETSTN